MIRRRRNREPVTRLDWRDPQMPVIRQEQLIDTWTNKVVETRTIMLTPHQEQMNAIHNMRYGINQDWRYDPLYNAAKRRRNVR